MCKFLEKFLERIGLKEVEDKFIILDGVPNDENAKVKVRVVAEPYPPPKKFRTPPEGK